MNGERPGWHPATYAKAITAAVTAGYALYEVSTSVGSPRGEAVSSGEWVRIAAFALLGFVSVWLVPNAGQESVEQRRARKAPVRGLTREEALAVREAARRLPPGALPDPGDPPK